MKVIGLDLGGSHLRGAIVENGAIVGEVQSVDTHSDASEEEVLKQVTDMIDGLMQGGVEAIGIGVPSIVVDGVVFEVPNIASWQKVELRDILSKKYDKPVHVDNDVNCMALAEHKLGAGKDYQNVVVLNLGTGLGCGVILNGQLHRGSHGTAGEIGHIPFKKHDVEFYCSGKFFEEAHGDDGASLAKMAAGGKKEAIDEFAEFGTNLGQAIATVVYAYDPEIIVIGGSITQSWKFFEPQMRQATKELAYQRTFSLVKVEKSSLEYDGVIGAALLCG